MFKNFLDKYFPEKHSLVVKKAVDSRALFGYHISTDYMIQYKIYRLYYLTSFDYLSKFEDNAGWCVYRGSKDDMLKEASKYNTLESLKNFLKDQDERAKNFRKNYPDEVRVV